VESVKSLNHATVDVIPVTVTLKFSGRRHTGFTYVTFKDTASVIRTNRTAEYNILRFSAYYDTDKFVWEQSGWLRKLESVDFEKWELTSNIVANK
jgi:hypothetical protein